MRMKGNILIVVSSLLITGFAWGQEMHGQQNQNGRMLMGMMGGNNQPGQTGMMGNRMNGMGMMSMMHGGMIGSGMMGGSVPSVFTVLGQSGALNLSAEQTESLQKAALELQKNLIRLRSQAAITGLDLQEVFDTADPDQQGIQKLLQKRNDTQAEMQQQLVSSYFQALKTLNEDQQTQLASLDSGCMMMGRGNGSGTGMRGMMNQ